MIVKVEGVTEMLKLLENTRTNIAKAASSAINRTATSTRAEIVRIGREGYTMPARTLRDSISIKKSNQTTLQAELTIQRKPIPLVEFKHKGGISTKILSAPQPAPRKRRTRIKPIQVQVRKSSGFKTIGRAFKAMGRKVGIFIRKGKERLPIQELPAVSPGGLVKSNLERITKYANSKLLQEIKSALRSGRFTGDE
jgi:hypothetical protein